MNKHGSLVCAFTWLSGLVVGWNSMEWIDLHWCGGLTLSSGYQRQLQVSDPEQPDIQDSDRESRED